MVLTIEPGLYIPSDDPSPFVFFSLFSSFSPSDPPTQQIRWNWDSIGRKCFGHKQVIFFIFIFIYFYFIFFLLELNVSKFCRGCEVISSPIPIEMDDVEAVCFRKEKK